MALSDQSISRSSFSTLVDSFQHAKELYILWWYDASTYSHVGATSQNIPSQEFDTIIEVCVKEMLSITDIEIINISHSCINLWRLIYNNLYNDMALSQKFMISSCGLLMSVSYIIAMLDSMTEVGVPLTNNLCINSTTHSHPFPPHDHPICCSCWLSLECYACSLKS